MLDLTVLFITRFANRPMHLLGLAGLVTSALDRGAVVLPWRRRPAAVVSEIEWNILTAPRSFNIHLMLIGVQFLTIELRRADGRRMCGSAIRQSSIKRVLTE
jgi:hypothetical protein